jgi:hypothetical protein
MRALKVCGTLLLVWQLQLGCSADRDDARTSTPTARSGPIAGGAGPGSACPSPVARVPTPVATGAIGASAPGSPNTTRPIGDGQCAAISQTAQNQLEPADVVWAIDNSGSMAEEMQFLRDNMNAFSKQISQSGIDVRIVLLSDVLRPDMMDPDAGMGRGGGRGRRNGICIDAPLGSGTCPDDSQLPAYLHVPQPVGSHDALDVIVMSYAQWMAQMRPGATKSFVVVTDDDAVQQPDPFGLFGPVTVPTAAERSAAFMTAVKALDPALFASFKLDAIYPFTMCQEAAAVGEVYAELVKATGGVGGDLCQQDFKPVFDELARGIVSASHIACEWTIPAAPSGSTFEVGKVNLQYATGVTPAPQTVLHVDAVSQCAAQGGWFYDDNNSPTRIAVCPATCDAIKNDPSAKVDILFGCATLVPQ